MHQQHRGEDMQSDESTVDVAAASAMGFLAHKLTSTNNVKDEEAGVDHEEVRTNRSICKHCGKEFKSGKALGGHLRIHSQQFQASAAAAASARLSTKKKYTQRQEEDQEDFACFGCGKRFESIRLLCQHNRKHRGDDHHKDNNDSPSNSTKDDDDQQPSLSEESSFLGKPLAEEENTNGDDKYYSSISGNQDLLKVPLPKWGRKRSRGGSASDEQNVDNKVYDAVPLRFYYGPEVPQSERKLSTSNKNKKLKTDDHHQENEDASVESKPQTSDDSEGTMELFGFRFKTSSSNGTTPNPMMPPSSAQGHQGIGTSSSHGSKRRRRWKKNEERVHQCEICGKIFATGHALGGHKTYHRLKEGSGVAVGTFRLVQRNPKRQVSGEFAHPFVQFRIGEHLEPEPNRVVDFDLNVPYQG